MPSPVPSSSPDFDLTVLARLHRRVALIGPIGAGATARLMHHHRTLLAEGVSADSVVAWVGPGEVARWRAGDGEGPAIAATPFQTWIRHELEAFWPLVEAQGGLPPAGPRRHGRWVDFSSSALAHYRMASETESLRERDQWRVRLRARPAAQVGQLLDTLGVAIDHGVSLEGAGERLTAAWAGSDDVKTCRAGIAEALEGYCAWGLHHRVLDAALQREVFQHHLWPLPAYRATLAQRVRHLIVDDWHTATPLMQAIVEVLAGIAETTVIALAPPGSVPMPDGADPVGAARIPADWHTVRCDAPRAPVPLVALGAAALNSWSGRLTEPVDPGEHLATRFDFVSRPAMLQAVVQDLRGLLAVGIPADNIAIVLPRLDRFALWFLTSELRRHEIPFQAWMPASPLIENRAVQVLTRLGRWVYAGRRTLEGSQWDQAVLEDLVGLDPLTAASLVETYGPSVPREDARLTPLPAWGRLLDFLERLEGEALPPFADFLRAAFQTLSVPRVEAVEQLVQLAEEFAAIAGTPENLTPAACGLAFLDFVEQGTVLERSAGTTGVRLARGEVYARSGPPVDFQFWLDLNAEAWRSPWRRELFDPLVLSCRWSGELDTPEEEERQVDLRLAATWNALLFKTRKAVRWYASDLDEEGREQTGGMTAAWERLLGARYVGLGVSS